MFKNSAVQIAVITAIVGPLLLAFFEAFVKPGLIDSAKESISAVGVSEETMRNKSQLIVLIENDQNELGSGFFVTRSLIVTSERIAKNAKSLKVIKDVEKNAPDTVQCVVKEVNTEYHYAILDFGRRIVSSPEFELSDRSVEKLDKIFTIGFAIERYFLVREGRIIQDDYYDQQREFKGYSADLSILAGMAGSPVFAKDGRVIGMVIGSISNADIAFIIPIIRVKQSVERLGGLE